MASLEFRHPAFRGHIGVAQCEITPPVGIYSRCWGAATHDTAASIHRPLTLTAMTIATDEHPSPLVLICGDLSFWKTPEAMAGFHERFLSKLGLPRENIIFALSHSHATPPLMLTDEPLPGGDLLQAWMESLPPKIVETVRAAEKNSCPATLEWETGRCTLAKPRDLPDPDPTQDRYLCGYTPDKDADDTLLVGRMVDLHGNMKATIVNYACHPTTLAWANTAISPDYIGATRELVERETGAPMLFLLGACGELAPRNQYTGDTSIPDAHGWQLGHAVLSTLAGMEPAGTTLKFAQVVESGAPLAAWEHVPQQASSHLQARLTTVEIPIKAWPSSAQIQEAYEASNDRYQKERLRRRLGIRLALGDGTVYPLPLSTLQIGDAIFVGSLGEAYSIFQKELRAEFPTQAVICMNLINGSLGYLPPQELYDLEIYPVWQTPFDRGCLEQTLSAARQTIHELLS
ncbi:alkaline ceramidase [Bremerella cremea]|uniref:Alkaline ceramidase n=1 Tax=Bremerella cremea TaxID=1031537 RepID=A0A368KVL4_9BACT|nr:alkaline ceramidase [Bremerella cremea]RCS54483.1 alkaline ceramidase [Bremerella cremea]